jgi:hypothetical protein
VHLRVDELGVSAPFERQFWVRERAETAGPGVEKEPKSPGSVRENRHCPRDRERADHYFEAYDSRRNSSGTSNRLG